MMNTNKKVELIAMSGTLGSGKNFIGENILLPMLPPKKTIGLAFANHFKVDAIVKCNLERDKVWGRKDDYTRKVLQRMGTEEGRDKFGDDIWIRLVEEWISYYETLGYERVIVFDCRFPNEVEYIQKRGGIVLRVESPERHYATAVKEAEFNGTDVEAILNHRSETSLKDFQGFDKVFYNDPTDNAFIQVRDFVREYINQTQDDTIAFVDLDDTLCHCHCYYMDIVEEATSNLVQLGSSQKTGLDWSDVGHVFNQYHNQLRSDRRLGVLRHESFSENLAQATELTLNDMGYLLSNPDQSQQLIADAYKLGFKVFDYDYDAFPGALDALKELEKVTRVIIYTLGDHLEQVKKLAYLGLSRMEHVITHDKNVTSFQGLMRKYPAKSYIMIGDNLDRDILPAIHAGASDTYWVQHNEEPWPSMAASGEHNTNRVPSFYEAVKQITENIKMKKNATSIGVPLQTGAV